MSRAILLLAALAACGKSASKKEQPVRVPDAAPVVVAPPDARPIDATPIGMGWMDHLLPVTDPNARHDPPPAAVVVIDADGTLHVMPSQGSWDALARATPPADAVMLDAVAAAVLDLDDAAGIAQAQTLRAELADTDANAPCDDCDRDETELSITYATPDALPPATPLIVAHPDAPGHVLLAVLDKVGGAIAEAVDGEPAIARLGYPWANGGWGGADLDDEPISIDLLLGHDLLAIPAGASPNLPIPIRGRAVEPKDLRFLMSDVLDSRRPDAVIDVLVTPAATAADVADAVAILEPTGRRIGVGVSPWPMRTR